MVIDLKTITERARVFSFTLDKIRAVAGERNGNILAMDGPFRTRLTIYKAGEKYVLEGELRGHVLLRCDRCLESYHRDLETSFRLFVTPTLLQTQETDVELIEEDLDVDFLHGDEIDVAKLINEQIYLSLPMKSVCRESCLGLCTKCGANLNNTHCPCQEEKGHPGFLKLQNLKIERY